MPGRSLSVVGLFAGIGGIEVGLAKSGHKTRLLCEFEPAAAAVLRAKLEGIPIHGDVRTLRALPAHTELITAGFPCQDLSQAGKTAGISGQASGLVGEVFRLLERRRKSRRAIPLVLLENVPFMLQLNRGRALEVIIGALERLGYQWAYRIVDTLAFGLPQRRERVFLIASLDEDPRGILFRDDCPAPEPAIPTSDLAFGFYWTEGVRGLGGAVDAIPTLKGGSTVGIPSPPAVLLPSGEIVTPGLSDTERLQGFEANWTQPAEGIGRRSARWKLVGNAVTVDVAAWIGRCLASPGCYDGGWDEALPPGRPWPRAAWNVGRGRFAASISSYPVRRPRLHLHEFLHHPKPLSAKATAGFWSRLQNSRLRRPVWVDEAIVRHLERMRHAETGLVASRAAAR